MDRRTRTPAGAATLQDRVTDALALAFFREWGRVGYTGLSIEAVARRAGVGKAAVYRRWPSKSAMAISLLTRVAVDRETPHDTGSLKGDVRAFLRHTARLIRRPLASRILPDIHAQARRSPALAEAMRREIQAPRRAAGAALLRRAVARGELPPSLDVDLALDLLGSLVYWRIVILGEPTDEAYLDRLSTLILRALEAS